MNEFETRFIRANFTFRTPAQIINLDYDQLCYADRAILFFFQYLESTILIIQYEIRSISALLTAWRSICGVGISHRDSIQPTFSKTTQRSIISLSMSPKLHIYPHSQACYLRLPILDVTIHFMQFNWFNFDWNYVNEIYQSATIYVKLSRVIETEITIYWLP